MGGGSAGKYDYARFSLTKHQDLVVTNQIAELRKLRNNGVIMDCRDQSDCGIA